MKKKLLLFSIYCCLISSVHAQIIRWDGSQNSNWNEPLNWNTGVLPTATNYVYLDDGMPNEPTVNVNAVAKAVIVDENTTLTINAGVTLDITATSGAGDALNNYGTVINNGTLELSNSVSARATIRNRPNSSFTNNSLVYVSDSKRPIHTEAGSSFVNNDEIDIYTSGIFDESLLYGGSITNNAGATMTIRGPVEVNFGTTVNNNTTASFKVEGQLEVWDATIINYSNFEVDGGTLPNSIFGLQLFSGAFFNNQADGILTVKDAAQAIRINDLTTRIFNYGIINIPNGESGIGVLSGGHITNYETINVNNTSSQAISVLSNSFGAGFLNAGGATINIDYGTGGGIRVYSSGIFNNEGYIHFLDNNNMAQAEFSLSSPFINQVSGEITGDYSFVGGAYSANGMMKPGYSPGVIDFDFNGWSNGSTGEVEIEIEGTNGPGVTSGHDQVTSGGTVVFDGTLDVSLISGFTPSAGDEFILFTCGTCNGTFATVNLPTAPVNTVWQVEYNANNVKLVLALILPVELVEFKAGMKDKTIELKWITQSEKDNQGFAIERMHDDNGEWEEIGFVRGIGNSSLENHYTFVDDKPNYGINYYRLKQIDFDQHFEYSKVIAAQFNSNVIQIYPNPVQHEVHINIGNSYNKGLIKIYNTTGKMVDQRTLTEGQLNSLNLQNLSHGVYLIEIILDGTKIRQERIVINK